MAMNKAEKAEMERLRHDLRLAKALHWPDYPRPQNSILPQSFTQGLFVGWWFNAYAGHDGDRVAQGCSNGTNHSTSYTDKTTTQRAAPHWGFFDTKREALLALRLEVTEQCAERLAAIDKRIEECS